MKDEEKAKIRAEIIMSLKKGYKPKVTMTAVEFLIQRLAKNGILHSSDIAEANELFKQQIIESYCQGCFDITKDEYIFPRETSEDYYNETYNNTNK